MLDGTRIQKYISMFLDDFPIFKFKFSHANVHGLIVMLGPSVSVSVTASTNVHAMLVAFSTDCNTWILGVVIPPHATLL